MTNLLRLRRLCDELPSLEVIESAADRKVRERSEQVRNQNRVELEGSLGKFLEAAWPSFDPADYRPCWAIDALCEHLQAVTAGDIRNLLVNFPPRCSKTNVTSVAYPAWTWARRESNKRSGPKIRFLCGSYGDKLAADNSLKTRRLILSDWYQSLWGDRFQLRRDLNTVGEFGNTLGGIRRTASVGGSLLGLGGDIIIIDDPHNTEQVESDAERETAIRWWKEVSTTRLNDPKETPLIVIMQRLHEEDVSGIVLSGEMSDWTHLCIPMEYEWRRHCVTSIGWQDPRGLDEDGEPLLIDGEPVSDAAAHILDNERERSLMWPERFDGAEIIKMKAGLGPYMASGRLQQMPVPDRGGIFDRTWWERYEAADGRFPTFDLVVASLDGAFTEKEENDPCALTVWGVYSSGSIDQKLIDARSGKIHYEKGPLNRRIMLMDAWRKHLKFSGDRRMIEPLPEGPTFNERGGQMKEWAQWKRETEEHWGLMEWLLWTCRLRKVDKLLIEAKASGISAGQELQNRFGSLLRNVAVILQPVKGDKVARALAVQPMLSQGMITAPYRDFADDLVIAEMAMFPKGKYDDLTDSTTQAWAFLRGVGMAQTDEEISSANVESLRHKPRVKPVYTLWS